MSGESLALASKAARRCYTFRLWLAFLAQEVLTANRTKTDTGRHASYAKTFEVMISKELCKIAP